MSAANYDLIAEKGTITITAPLEFQIPNAFTPNSDGHNDTFKMVQNGSEASIRSIKFSVYTKSGKQIFYTEKIGEGWDGRYRGVMLESDVYYYIIEIIKINGEPFSSKKPVYLLK